MNIQFRAFITSVSVLGLSTVVHADPKKSFEENRSASSISASSYTETIQQVARDAKSVLEQGLQEFNKETLPGEARDLRKQLVRLRDVLDIYSHNFLNQLKLWDDIRDGLDEGYTLIGDFKDLAEVQMPSSNSDAKPRKLDEKKVKNQRKLVLKWKEDYFQAGGWSDKVSALFSQIQPLSSSTLTNSKKFSNFFWGGVEALPAAINSPAQNARILLDAQSNRVFDEHNDFLELSNLRKEKNEVVFHDHRKRIRTVTKICNLANAMEEETCRSGAVKSVEKLVARLGEIEDLIVAARQEEEDGKHKKADECYEKAEKLFEELKKDNKKEDLLEPLKLI